MKLAAYVRVSTDDKGQRPERQRELLEAWADAAGHRVVAYGVDEGISGATNPFTRDGFAALVNTAVEEGAHGVVVESPDRLTRQGSAWYGWAQVELQIRFGLQLVSADIPRGDAAEVIEAVKSSAAKQWLDRHAAATRSGMESSGNMGGRPRKLDAELLRRINYYHLEGLSVRRIALEVSRERGAYEVTDERARRKRTISARTVQRGLEQLRQNPSRGKTPVKRSKTEPPPNGTLLPHPEGVPP